METRNKKKTKAPQLPEETPEAKRRRDENEQEDSDDETVGEEEHPTAPTPPSKKQATTAGGDEETITTATSTSSPDSADNQNGQRDDTSGAKDKAGAVASQIAAVSNNNGKPKHQSIHHNNPQKVFVNPYRLPLHPKGRSNSQSNKTKQDLAKEEAKNKQRKLEYKQALANQEAKRTGKAKQTNKKKMDEQEKRWFNQISISVKTVVWRAGKFCNNDVKLDNMTRVVMIHMQPDKLRGLKGKHLASAERKWIAENRDLVRVAFNDCRNYTSNNLRDEALKRGMANKPIPTTDQMLQCITRDHSWNLRRERPSLMTTTKIG